MIQYIADEAHFKEVIARVANVKKQLWIGTADIKDLKLAYIGCRKGYPANKSSIVISFCTML